MEPDFREGDAVVIDPEVIPLPGDFVVAKNGEEEALFKSIDRAALSRAEVFELVPLNEDYPTLRSDQVPIRIIGTMIEHRRYRKDAPDSIFNPPTCGFYPVSYTHPPYYLTFKQICNI